MPAPASAPLPDVLRATDLIWGGVFTLAVAWIFVLWGWLGLTRRRLRELETQLNLQRAARMLRRGGQ